MNFLCLTRDVPEFPQVKHVKEFGYITKKNDVFLSVPGFCKHMGYPLVEGDKWSAYCKFHGINNQIDNNSQFVVTDSGYIFDGHNEAFTLLPNLNDYWEFGAVVTSGSFTKKMWLENTVDLDHLPHVHPHSFAPILDTRLSQTQLLPGGYSRVVVPVKPGTIDGLCKLFSVESPYFAHYLAADNVSITNFCFAFISVETIADNRATTRFFAHNSITDKKFLELVLRGNKKILDEDAVMLSRLDKASYERGQLKNTDVRIAWYRKHAKIFSSGKGKDSQDGSHT